METVMIVKGNYIGNTNINIKIYNLILNLLMEHILNNQNIDYNEIANRNV